MAHTMIRLVRKLLLGVIPLLLIACSDGADSVAAIPGIVPGPYAVEDLWLCKPGAASNRCLELDQTITQVFEDGNIAVFEHEPATDSSFDCFYVYPTVDVREEPGNTQDLSDDSLMLRPLYNQAARFTELCHVYAPKYRQMTIGSYDLENVFESEYFELAYSDVEEAFNQYLLENPDRNFVLLGHSQGSHILLQLMQRHIDNNDDLRARMISALTIGPTGVLEVPAGELTGGTFQNIPLCTHATDTACVIAYDSIAAGQEQLRPESQQPVPCVNPTMLGSGTEVAANTIYNADEGIPFPEGVETHWIGYPGLYAGSCERDGFLGISVAPGRSTLFTPLVIQTFLGGTTLHQADYNFAMGDLLNIVGTQAAHH